MDDKEIKAEDLLGAYATSTLNPAERRKLLEAALADQGIFNALAQEETLREALEDRVFRGRVIARLRELDARAPVGSLRRIWAWWRQPVVIGPALALAALACVLLLRSLPDGRSPSGAPPVRTAPAGYDPQSKGLDLSSEPSGTGVALGRLLRDARRAPADLADLDLNHAGRVPAYSVGDALRIEFSVSRAASVLVLVQDPADSVKQLFPSRRQPSSRVPARTRVQIPRAGQGYHRVAGPPGRYSVALLVFPPGVDPLSAAVLDQDPLAVRREYEVVP